MKTLLRTLISLLLTLWLGGVLFFLVVAGIAFRTLPQVQAGALVRACLLTLHNEGLVAGSLLLVLLLAAAGTRAYGRTLVGPVSCTVAMLLLTALSQFSVIPRMEADRLAAGGDMHALTATDPRRAEFDRLHAASVRLEGGVLVSGVAMAVFLALPGRRAMVGRSEQPISAAIPRDTHQVFRT